MRLARTGAWIVTLLAVTCVFAGPRPDAQHLKRAASLTYKAGKALEAGNVDRARELYRKATEVVRQFPDAHLGLGHVAMRERRFEDALAAYRRALEGHGWMVRSIADDQHQTYADAQDRLADLQSALARYEHGSTGPSLSAYETTKMINRMKAEISRLQNIDPPRDVRIEAPSGRYHFYLGNALANLDMPDQAIAEWETCIREEPEFAPAYNNLAVAYWKAGRVGDAFTSLSQAEELGLEVHPEFRAALRRAVGRTGVASATSPPSD